MTAGHPLKILIVSPLSVYPISHGGASRIANIAWELTSSGHEVHVLALVESEREIEEMASMPNVASSAGVVFPLLTTHLPGTALPAAVRNGYRPAFGAWIERTIKLYGIDILQFEYTQTAAYRRHSVGRPVVLVEHDIAYRSLLRSVRRSPGLLRRAYRAFDFLRLYHWELSNARLVDLVLTVSDQEARILRDRGVSTATGAVPNGVAAGFFAPPEGAHRDRDVLFVGSFKHGPNVDGVRYLLKDIVPRLADGVTISIVGADLPEALRSRALAAGVRCAGFVEDLRVELWRHKVFAAPIRYGAGTRMKLLEAAAAGMGIVSTTIGAEGLGFEAGRELLLADTPERFALATTSLLEDVTLRERLGNEARRAVGSRFDWTVGVRNLQMLYAELLA